MTQKFNLKFLKLDKFGNHVFLASEKVDPVEYAQICQLGFKLMQLYPDAAGSPTYNGNGFASLRLNKQTKFNFYEKSIYNLTFKLKKNTIPDGRVFINAILISSKLLKRGEDEDSGSDIEL